MTSVRSRYLFQSFAFFSTPREYIRRMKETKNPRKKYEFVNIQPVFFSILSAIPFFTFILGEFFFESYLCSVVGLFSFPSSPCGRLNYSSLWISYSFVSKSLTPPLPASPKHSPLKLWCGAGFLFRLEF